MYGAILGDIIGSPYEFDCNNYKSKDFPLFFRHSEFTDDTVMTLAVAKALLDAVGGAIHHIGNIHKYARREDVPEKTMFIITTDGYENASRRYSYETVRGMIERQKEKYGWEFLFLGANIDAAKEAARFGISAERAVDYKCDEVGTALNYDVISEAICTVRAKKTLGAGWKRRIDADVQKRGR